MPDGGPSGGTRFSNAESRALKLVASLPLVVAPAFAIVLMLDAVYRVAGGRSPWAGLAHHRG